MKFARQQLNVCTDQQRSHETVFNHNPYSYILALYIESFFHLLQMTVKDLEHVIEKLEKEKAELNSALNAKKANPSSLR